MSEVDAGQITGTEVTPSCSLLVPGAGAKSVATAKPEKIGGQTPEHSPKIIKYQRWHDQIIERARYRKPLACYYESHHVEPRSLGGLDISTNLVNLTYREHFLVHWLLTKIKTDGALRRMQRALFAVSLSTATRDVSTWQLAVAKRSVRDLAIDPEAEAIWLERFREAEAERLRLRKYRLRDRNGNRAKLRRANLASMQQAIKPGSKLDRSELAKLANSVLYPGRRS